MIIRFGIQTLLLLSLFIPGTILQAADITLWDVAGKAEISLEQAAGKFPSPGIVYVGEFHDNAAHHAAQLAVIQSLEESRARAGRPRECRCRAGRDPTLREKPLDAWKRFKGGHRLPDPRPGGIAPESSWESFGF